MIKVKDVAIKNSLCHSQEGVVYLKIERDKVMEERIVGKGCENAKEGLVS